MPARFQVRITEKAERDVEEIWSFIAQDDIEAANRLIMRLERQIETLERFPARCPLIAENDLIGPSYKHLLFGDYRIVFRVIGKRVYVVRVLNYARLLNPASLGQPFIDEG